MKKEVLYIVMPAYNEEANIEDVIRQWHPVAERINEEGNEAHLVIANDGSKDNTFAIMQQLQSKYQYLLPLDKVNSGHGATVLYLYRYAIGNGANYVFQTDSDGQTMPDEFWQMWEHRHEYDFQIGTRGGRQDGFSRIVVTKTLRLVVWLMFHVWVKDANTPFRLMKASSVFSGRLIYPRPTPRPPITSSPRAKGGSIFPARSMIQAFTLAAGFPMVIFSALSTSLETQLIVVSVGP